MLWSMIMPTKNKSFNKMIREQFGNSPDELRAVLLETVKVVNALTGSKPEKVEVKKAVKK